MNFMLDDGDAAEGQALTTAKCEVVPLGWTVWRLS